eukprot:scaffold64591_cov30-Tisochrysis_lutea.AAC.2
MVRAGEGAVVFVLRPSGMTWLDQALAAMEVASAWPATPTASTARSSTASSGRPAGVLPECRMKRVGKHRTYAFKFSMSRALPQEPPPVRSLMAVMSWGKVSERVRVDRSASTIAGMGPGLTSSEGQSGGARCSPQAQRRSMTMAVSSCSRCCSGVAGAGWYGLKWWAENWGTSIE